MGRCPQSDTSRPIRPRRREPARWSSRWQGGNIDCAPRVGFQRGSARSGHSGPVAEGGAAWASQRRGRLLDLGCGYGPIACVLATTAPAATVYAVDVNTRALELTKANAAALGLDIRISEPNAVPDDPCFPADLVESSDSGRQAGAACPAQSVAAPVDTGRERVAGGRPPSWGGLAQVVAAGAGITACNATRASKASGAPGPTRPRRETTGDENRRRIRL